MTCGISSISAPSYEEVTASEMFCHKPPSNWGWEELDSGMKTKGQTRLGTGQANPVNAWPLPPRPEQLQAALLQAEPLQSPAPPLPRRQGKKSQHSWGRPPETSWLSASCAQSQTTSRLLESSCHGIKNLTGNRGQAILGEIRCRKYRPHSNWTPELRESLHLRSKNHSLERTISNRAMFFPRGDVKEFLDTFVALQRTPVRKHIQHTCIDDTV